MSDQSDLMSDESDQSGSNALDELDKLEKDRMERSIHYYDQWNRIFQLLVIHPTGINVASLFRLYLNKYGQHIDTAGRTFEGFLDKEFTKQVEVNPTTKNFRGKPKKSRNVAILSLVGRLIDSGNGQEIGIQLRKTAEFLPLLRRVIKHHPDGVFVDRLQGLFGSVYMDGSVFKRELAKYGGDIEFLISQLKELSFHSSRTFPDRKYVKIKALPDDETDDFITEYFIEHAEDIRVQSRKIVEMVTDLQQTAEPSRLIPFRELAPLYQACYRRPLWPLDRVYNIIDSIPQLTIDENYIIVGKPTTVISLASADSTCSRVTLRYSTCGSDLDPLDGVLPIVRVCLVEPNASALFVQLDKTSADFITLTKEIESWFNDSNPEPAAIGTIRAGMPILSRMDEKGALSRGIVMAGSNVDHTFIIKFVDCGRISHNNRSELFHILPQFMLLPVQAIECRFPRAEEDETWPIFLQPDVDWIGSLVQLENRFKVKSMAYLKSENVFQISLIHIATGLDLLAEIERYMDGTAYPVPRLPEFVDSETETYLTTSSSRSSLTTSIDAFSLNSDLDILKYHATELEKISATYASNSSLELSQGSTSATLDTLAKEIEDIKSDVEKLKKICHKNEKITFDREIEEVKKRGTLTRETIKIFLNEKLSDCQIESFLQLCHDHLSAGGIV